MSDENNKDAMRNAKIVNGMKVSEVEKVNLDEEAQKTFNENYLSDLIAQAKKVNVVDDTKNKGSKTRSKKNKVIVESVAKEITGKSNEQEPFSPNANFVSETGLYQLLGDRGDGVYKTRDINEYKADIDKMNKAELFKHAAEKGIMPKISPDRVRKELLKKFQAHYNKYKNPSKDQIVEPIPPNEKILEIMRKAM